MQNLHLCSEESLTGSRSGDKNRQFYETNPKKYMKSKEELIAFLDNKVLTPVENDPKSNITIKRKVRATRMRLNNLVSAEKVVEFFWNAMATDRGIDSYKKIKAIGGTTFEDVREEFKKLCGH